MELTCLFTETHFQFQISMPQFTESVDSVNVLCQLAIWSMYQVLLYFLHTDGTQWPKTTGLWIESNWNSALSGPAVLIKSYSKCLPNSTVLCKRLANSSIIKAILVSFWPAMTAPVTQTNQVCVCVCVFRKLRFEVLGKH